MIQPGTTNVLRELKATSREAEAFGQWAGYQAKGVNAQQSVSRLNAWLDAAGQARLRRLLRWRDAEARRSDRPKSWVLDNELAVQLSRRPHPDFAPFNLILDASPKAPRKARYGRSWGALAFRGLAPRREWTSFQAGSARG